MPGRFAPCRAPAALQWHPFFARRALLQQQCPALGCNSFHSTPDRRDDIDSKNHYETLQISPNATPAEIKKSFYTLSKTHHPDHNPTDPLAPKRFMRISEAYAILSHTDKRTRYDRDVLCTSSSTSSSSSSTHGRDHPTRRGSYSSTGPAGGRPPSGLSRRRGQFRGPPPSFYRSGGWGEQTRKRQAAHEATSSASAEFAGGTGGGFAQGEGSDGYARTAPGSSPGSNPFGYRDGPLDDGHFDSEGHFRTQEHVDARRTARRRREQAEMEGLYSSGGSSGGTFSLAGSFFMVCAVLTAGLVVPAVVIGVFSGGEEGRRMEMREARRERERLRRNSSVGGAGGGGG